MNEPEVFSVCRDGFDNMKIANFLKSQPIYIILAAALNLIGILIIVQTLELLFPNFNSDWIIVTFSLANLFLILKLVGLKVSIRPIYVYMFGFTLLIAPVFAYFASRI